MKSRFLVFGAILSLSGCGGGDVEKVKALKFPLDESYTLSQILDNRGICADTHWKSFADSKGRQVVEYRCNLKGVEEYFKAVLQYELDRPRRGYQESIDSIQKQIDYATEIKTSSEQTLAENEAKLKELTAKSLDPNDPDAFITEREIQFAKGAIFKSKDDIAYRQQNIDRYMADMNEVSLEDFEQRFADNTAKAQKEYEARATKIEDIMQWVIVDEEPQLIASGIVLEYPNSEPKEVNLSATTMLGAMANDQLSGFTQYAKALNLR